MPRTKIVCTMGPASRDPHLLEAMLRAGMSLARINLSHGEREDHRVVVQALREAGEAVGKPIPILMDLQGPKIRVGLLDAPMTLKPGQEVTIAPDGEHSEGEIPTTYRFLAEDLKVGDRVLLDDGLLQMVCRNILGNRAEMEVVEGGILHSRKGINLPGVEIREPSLTAKDLEDLEFALEQEAEFIGLSFVRKPEDVEDLKNRVDGKAKVVAKIEKAEAMAAIHQILEVTDAVMVARGDLGVELPFEEVPLAQKRIIQLANFHARPVITATQMLESMIEGPRPTRAEASDVANAILDGTGAVMLSGETAVGKNPLAAVEALARIAKEVDRSGAMDAGPQYLALGEVPERTGASLREHAVASACVESVATLGAAAVIALTRSGFTAQLVSSYKPPVPVFAVTTDPLVQRQLRAVWGVEPILAVGEEVTYDHLLALGKEAVLQGGFGKPGDSVVVTAGYPFHTAGSTNTMRVEEL
jgi:pyruvate kinase